MGVDVAIRGDLFSLVIMELVGDVAIVREIIAEKGLSFKAQEELMALKCTQYTIIKISIDQTGMGEKVVEDAKRHFGNHRVDGILFTNSSKHYLATSFHNGLTDKKIRLPANHAVREDLHSIKKTTLPTGTVRLDADRSSGSHADRAWASMLAYHGLRNGYRPVEIQHVSFAKPARVL